MRIQIVVAMTFAVGSFALACSGGQVSNATAVETVAPDAREHARSIEALRPPKRARPVIAVLADNAGTETTDFIVPFGVLARSMLAEVVAVAPDPGPVKLMPALTIQIRESTATFDARYPDGADYVVVPAMHRRDAPRILDWIRAQAATGATIVAVCSGAMVLAETGLLADRLATTHWFDIDALEEKNPTLRRVNDRRYVVDRGIVTTTGVSASVPVSLAIVEAIGGRPAARALAGEFGANDWSAAHTSAAFRLDFASVALAARNWLAFWSHQRVGIAVHDDVDEVALALTADAYSRTFRSTAYAMAEAPGPLETKGGLVLLPDYAGDPDMIDRFVPIASPDQAARTLDEVLRDIASDYGERVARFVALQLEYPGLGWTARASLADGTDR